jgi:hypothetical protein
MFALVHCDGHGKKTSRPSTTAALSVLPRGSCPFDRYLPLVPTMSNQCSSRSDRKRLWLHAKAAS